MNNDSDQHLGSSQLHNAAFIQELRQMMIKFTQAQLADSQLVEDVVQEALAGALKNADAFARRSALRSWVFAILKNKIADALRQQQKHRPASELTSEYKEGENFDELFDQRGHWLETEKPAPWPSPSEEAQNDQFWVAFERCVNGLPAKHAEIFMMREVLERASNEICQETGVSLSNLNVILYRARMRLRECLQINWFNSEHPFTSNR